MADIASPSEESRSQPFELGEPQFEIPLSGWYWQITRLDSTEPNIQSSRSLFAARLPQLAANGVPAGVGGARSGYVKGPDDKLLRIVERIIDTGDKGIFLVQVAATTAEMEAEVAGFELALDRHFHLAGRGARRLIRACNCIMALRRCANCRKESPRSGAAKAKRSPAPLSPDLAPLAGEVNLLLGANRAVVERARTQVGNLAHALKTPLSVIINEATLEPGRSPARFRSRPRSCATSWPIISIARRRRFGSVPRQYGGCRAGTAGLVRAFEKIYRDRAIVFSANVAPESAFAASGRILRK